MAAAAEEVRTMQPGLPALTSFLRKWWDSATAETALHSRLASWAGSVLRKERKEMENDEKWTPFFFRSASFPSFLTHVDSKNPVTMYPALKNRHWTSMSAVAAAMGET